MTTVDLKQRLAAVATAVSVTFSIVWGLASYAYAQPAQAGLVQLAAQKTCRG